MTTVLHTPWLFAVTLRPQALLLRMLTQALYQDIQRQPGGRP